MPVIKSAKKKLKVDQKREFANKKFRIAVDFIIKKTAKNPSSENLQKAFRSIDKGVKNRIFHKNKASRMKSRLSKLADKKSQLSSKTKKVESKKPRK